MPVPPAAREAREAALRAALEVFDETGSALAAGSPQAESQAPNKNSSKGNVVPFGQTETSQPNRRFFRMNFSSRSTQAIAASIVALVIVAPVAFRTILRLSEFKAAFGTADYARHNQTVACSGTRRLDRNAALSARRRNGAHDSTFRRTLRTATRRRRAAGKEQGCRSCRERTRARSQVAGAGEAQSRDDGAKVATERLSRQPIARSSTNLRKSLPQQPPRPPRLSRAPAASGKKSWRKAKQPAGSAASRPALRRQAIARRQAASAADFSEQAPAPQNVA